MAVAAAPPAATLTLRSMRHHAYTLSFTIVVRFSSYDGIVLDKRIELWLPYSSGSGGNSSHVKKHAVRPKWAISDGGSSSPINIAKNASTHACAILVACILQYASVSHDDLLESGPSSPARTDHKHSKFCCSSAIAAASAPTAATMSNCAQCVSHHMYTATLA